MGARISNTGIHLSRELPQLSVADCRLYPNPLHLMRSVGSCRMRVMYTVNWCTSTRLHISLTFRNENSVRLDHSKHFIGEFRKLATYCPAMFVTVGSIMGDSDNPG